MNQVFQNVIYPKPALLPTMKWIDSIAPSAPKLKIAYGRDGYKVLQWTVQNDAKENLQFAVYRFDKNESLNRKSALHLVAIVSEPKWVDKTNQNSSYKYVVSALDRLHNESAFSNEVE